MLGRVAQYRSAVGQAADDFAVVEEVAALVGQQRRAGRVAVAGVEGGHVGEFGDDRVEHGQPRAAVSVGGVWMGAVERDVTDEGERVGEVVAADQEVAVGVAFPRP
jgi:hypothetical protein